MNKYNSLKQRIRLVIPNIHDYWESIFAEEVFVGEYSSDSTCYILKNINKERNVCELDIIDKQNKCIHNILMNFDYSKIFKIIHPKTVSFVPIDGKRGLLGGSSNCDFIFFNKTTFCFVELKLNAISLNEKSIRDNRWKAVQQIKNTVNYFDSILSKNYFGLILEAYVSTPDSYPRESTNWQSFKVKFLEETGIRLNENKEKKYFD